MNRNRIGGGAFWGERADDRDAPATDGRQRKSGGRALKADGLAWGDLALRLKGRRRERSEKSAEAVVSRWRREKGQTEGRARRP
jgi:hypothetical protein